MQLKFADATWRIDTKSNTAFYKITSVLVPKKP